VDLDHHFSAGHRIVMHVRVEISETIGREAPILLSSKRSPIPTLKVPKMTVTFSLCESRGSVPVLAVSQFVDCQFGWLRGAAKSLKENELLVTGTGFEPKIAQSKIMSATGRHRPTEAFALHLFLGSLGSLDCFFRAYLDSRGSIGDEARRSARWRIQEPRQPIHRKESGIAAKPARNQPD
jgi:hypothetical protein